MATLREYFDLEFDHTVKIHCAYDMAGQLVDLSIMCDFNGYVQWFACYVPGQQHSFEFFVRLLQNLKRGETQLALKGTISLPSSRVIHADFRVANNTGMPNEDGNPVVISARLWGSPDYVAWTKLITSSRLFIYSESELTDAEIGALVIEGRKHEQEVVFRSQRYAMRRSQAEFPVAFISHDSRDADVAMVIATNLQRMLFSVWYDEFSLKAGDNLRDSIEKGLKSCKKCILVLSKNFLANGGWTKKEFDSIFTREVLEQKQLVLPVWRGVTKEEVYEYSPSLSNVKGLNWNLGEDEVCKRLAYVLIGHVPTGNFTAVPIT